MNRRIVLSGLLVLVIVLGVIGFDLSQLQAGLETPSEVVIEITSATTLVEYPPITAYDSFSVQSEEDIAVDVHMREVPDATANIFMVHGAGGGAWAWEAYFSLLPDTYNLYAISWRGHFTSTPVDDADTADYAQDQIAALMAIAQRNGLPIHVIAHSYGGATSVLAQAQMGERIASLHLLAPVVPLDYSFLQAQIVPRIMPPILSMATAMESRTESTQPYAGMFLNQTQMEQYWDLYAGKDYSIEKPGLIARDGVSVAWQARLNDAYQSIGKTDLPVWFLIARYDNVVVPDRQRQTATAMGASLIELESGHYIQLDVEAEKSANMITANLDTLLAGNER